MRILTLISIIWFGYIWNTGLSIDCAFHIHLNSSAINYFHVKTNEELQFSFNVLVYCILHVSSRELKKRHLMRNWFSQRAMLLWMDALEKNLQKTMMKYLQHHRMLMKNQEFHAMSPVWWFVSLKWKFILTMIMFFKPW